MSYMRGARAAEFAALPEGERAARLLAHWEQVFPGVRQHVESSTSTSWITDAWAGGAYTAPLPGQAAELVPHVATPEGRVHFAGEHASSDYGWMQGALASGLRAAAEVSAAPAAAA
jgi:monoamine oxidase